jgi:hypothetical protein
MTMVDVSQSAVPSGRAKGWIEGVLGGIFALRVPFVMGVITVAVLTVPDQMREIHRILTQERTILFFNWHWVFCLLALVALSLVLWQTSRQHAEEYLDDMPDDPPMHAAGRGLLVWGPRVLATLPLLGTALGIWLSRTTTVDLTEIEGDIPDALKGIVKLQNSLAAEFTLGAVTCLGLAVVVFVVASMFERNLAPVGSRRARRVAVVNNWALFPLLILASIGLLIYSPVKLPQELGSIPIFALWMANLAVLFALFWRYSRIIGFPILAALIVVLVVFEVTGSTDNHRFRHAIPAKEIERPSVEESFRAWIASRADLEAYRSAGKPYPLYIVAAEGGGLYAAFQTAKLLGRMQDLCDNFAQHVFVVSSVSGGSLGSAVFSGLAQESAKNGAAVPCKTGPQRGHGPFERAAENVLSRDLLSPVIWATLFPDFLQRFIPYPFPKLDRGYTLELAFEDTWTYLKGTKKNYLQGSFFGMCGNSPADCAKGATPALALNLTNIETGMQMVLSQMEVNTWPFDGPPRLLDMFSSNALPVELPLSTAVGLSARFPWISPQGWYSFVNDATGSGAKRRMSFVDGGYVDNSGVATATKLARVLSYITSKDATLPKVDIKLITISAAWIPFERFWMDPPKDQPLSEYVSPFVAALAAWQGRGFTAQSDLSTDQAFKVIDMGVYYNFMPLPVGWHLSSLSRTYVDLFRGDPDKCDLGRARPSLNSHAAMAASYIYRANCAAAEVVKDLTPK